ncbi:MAG TPA: acetyl-CoA carboxylase biotin carboxyl carrier protein subunit [Pseudogracilibacillus sp.]|nr:acetyl-CoA carboxylase biotin carboxyl carrier protein subunit [Pseudogracilibacillus sp.]
MSEVKASMAGSMWKLLVKEGDQITEGEDVGIMESMKMEIPLPSPKTGTIQSLKVEEGAFLNEGDIIAVIE